MNPGNPECDKTCAGQERPQTQAGEFEGSDMTKLQSNLAAALVIVVGASSLAAHAQAAEPRCRHTLEEYTGYARQLAPFANMARKEADRNPIYESDAQYYAAELADAEQCVKSLAPIATAFR
jgi:hypothetical protein